MPKHQNECVTDVVTKLCLPQSLNRCMAFALNLAYAKTFISFALQLIFHFNFLDFKKAWAMEVTPFPGLKSHVDKYSIPWKKTE